MIVNVILGELETVKLLITLKKYPKAIGYTIDYLKGIGPSVCMCKIMLQGDYKPSRE